MATIKSAELNRIGDGPVATVFSGHHAGVPVALKVYPKRFDKRTLSAYQKEQARLTALRRVTSILTVDGIDELDTGEPALRMELCGQSLSGLVDRYGPVAPADAVVLGRAIATALAAAHERGVVHGGISPHNVLFRTSGEPVLADFGVTLRQAFARDPLHAIEFLPPETLRTGELGEGSDLYGLGAILHYALTGRSPHPGRLGEQPGERVLRILGEPVPAINNQEVPIGLSTLVARLLAAHPDRRPTGTAAVAAQLGDMLPNPPQRQAASDFDDFDAPMPAAPPVRQAPPQVRSYMAGDFDDFSGSQAQPAVQYAPPPAGPHGHYQRPPGPGAPPSHQPYRPPAAQFPPRGHQPPPAHVAPPAAAQAPPQRPAPPAQVPVVPQLRPPAPPVLTPPPAEVSRPAPPVNAAPPAPPAQQAPSVAQQLRVTVVPTAPAAPPVVEAPPAEVSKPAPPQPQPPAVPTANAGPPVQPETEAPPVQKPSPAEVNRPAPPVNAAPPAQQAPSVAQQLRVTVVPTAPAAPPVVEAPPAEVGTPAPPVEAQPQPKTPVVPAPDAGPPVPTEAQAPPVQKAAPVEVQVPVAPAAPPAQKASPVASLVRPPVAPPERPTTEISAPVASPPEPRRPDASPEFRTGVITPVEERHPVGLGDPPRNTGEFADFAPEQRAPERTTAMFFPPPVEERKRRIRYDLLAGAGLVLALLALLPLLFLRNDPDELRTTPQIPEVGPPQQGEVEIVLDEPVDLTDKVELSWRANKTELDFYVIIAVEGEEDVDAQFAERNLTMTVEVRPGIQYCFLIQAVEASHDDDVYESDPRGLRGATCTQ